MLASSVDLTTDCMTGAPASPSIAPDRKSSHWSFLIKAVVSIALLGVLLSMSDTRTLAAHLAEISWPWLVVALGLYAVMIVVSAWRWGQLLVAQDLNLPTGTLVRSYLIATYFNNFLPSNIGGDVVRIKDTAVAAGSKTLATTVVLIDRGIGLLALLLVAAVGASLVARGPQQITPVWPPLLWICCLAGTIALCVVVVSPDGLVRLLSPLRMIRHDWIDLRLQRMAGAFTRFRARPSSLVNGFFGAIVVQLLLVAFYMAVAASLHIPIAARHLAVLVPVSFIVQMLPVSMNGFGVREATFSYYFRALGLPIESALLLSLVATATILIFSLSGAALYVSRR